MGFRDWRFLLPASIVGIYALIAVVGPLLVGYDHVAIDPRARLLPPGTRLDNGEVAIMGTDQLGRDVFAQVVTGARVSMAVGAATVVFAGLVGSLLGMVAGYTGKVLDSIFMRIGDVQLAFPSILLAIFIAAFLGPSILNVIITLTITRWVVFARVARGQTLAVKKREFVEATVALGSRVVHIFRRCVIPACTSALVVVGTVELGLVMIAEASLSFLGLGTPAATPSWGLTVANGRDHLDTAWWISAMPGAALALLVICVGTLGDQLRDRLDPYMRGISGLR